MTMQPQFTSTLTAVERAALRAQQQQALATLAKEWAVEAVGRHYPTHHTRAGGYRFIRPGKWYVVRAGERVAASAAQSRELTRRAGDLGGPYGSIGPVAAA